MENDVPPSPKDVPADVPMDNPTDVPTDPPTDIAPGSFGGTKNTVFSYHYISLTRREDISVMNLREL